MDAYIYVAVVSQRQLQHFPMLVAAREKCLIAPARIGPSMYRRAIIIINPPGVQSRARTEE